ncbi:MAG: Fic family protein [Patescibacteria group bacterium]|nr:Fic family protein [Patescibacteria group bacterium]
MVEPSRYDIGGDEGDILKNKLGITDQKTLEDTETLLLVDAYELFFDKLEGEELVFDLDLIFEIHAFFLGPLYSWAGKVRTVEISKNGVLFASSLHINQSLEFFDKILKKELPKPSEPKKVVAKKLAILHCEFNAIHPFREGNGRTIRLFFDLIAVHCGFNIIDFGETKKNIYIAACIAGMKQDYTKMEQLIYEILKKK